MRDDEESIINGILHHRRDPHALWVAYTPQELTVKLIEARNSLGMVRGQYSEKIDGMESRDKLLDEIHNALIELATKVGRSDS